MLSDFGSYLGAEIQQALSVHNATSQLDGSKAQSWIDTMCGKLGKGDPEYKVHSL